AFVGRVEHWDIPAAYAQTLGEITYGGRWFHERDLPQRRPPEWWARDGRPVFVAATVRLPDGLPFGPLPRRPRRRLDHQEAMIFTGYPTAGRLQGVWCWQELQAACEHGARIVKVRDTWVHLSLGQPFLPWWQAVERGRQMPGLAGVLSKITGNALWGQFCMDPAAGGRRTIRGRIGPTRAAHPVERPLSRHGGRPPAHDLAETVSGRVRARLYGAMVLLGDRLLSAHT